MPDHGSTGSGEGDGLGDGDPGRGRQEAPDAVPGSERSEDPERRAERKETGEDRDEGIHGRE